MKSVYVVLLAALIGLSSAQFGFGSFGFSDIPAGPGSSFSRSVAVSTPDESYVNTYQSGGGNAYASASGPAGKITCESPQGPIGTAVVCSGSLPKNVTGAVKLYSKIKGYDWCLKAEEDGNIVLSSDCSGTYLWYFDEEYGLRPVYSTSCAAISLDDTTSYFSGNCYLEEEKCEEVNAKWFFDGYYIKNDANPDLCLTVCVSPEDGCNTIPGIDTRFAYGVAIADCSDSYAQFWFPENYLVKSA